MWRSLAPRMLFLSSLHSSSSSTIPRPYFVRSSLFPPPPSDVIISVWWDCESCNLPTGVNTVGVQTSIFKAIEANGIRSRCIQFNAFGDIFQLSNREDLCLTFNHISNETKNSVKRSLLFNLLYWVSKNPPPVHLFLISGDRDLAYVLPHLRMKNYNILLATADSAPDVLRSAVSVMWCWNSLATRENIIGTHLNHPPDDSYGLDYGHSKQPDKFEY